MPRVLIVDDWADARYLLKAILEHDGYEVLEATDGAEALRLARAGACDLIISDGLMPVMDGFRLCLELKRDAATASLPFIFHTASFTETADMELASDMGADAYLLKPASREVILSTVRTALASASEVDTTTLGNERLTDVLDRYGGRIEQKLDQKVADLEQTRALRDSYHALLDHLPALIITLDAEGRPDFANSTAVSFAGTGEPSALIEAVHPEDAPSVQETVASLLSDPRPIRTTLRIRHAGSGYRVIDLSACPYETPDGVRLGFVLAGVDITAQEQQRELLRHAAEHDPLTDLPTRHVFDRRFDEILRNIGRGASCALLFIESDSVGGINDRYGFDIGDATVANLARTIADAVRPGDLVARLCATEFVVLAEGIGRSDAEDLADRIRERVAGASLVPAASDVRVSVDININVVPEDGSTRPLPAPTRTGTVEAVPPAGASALREALEGAPTLSFVPVYSLGDGRLARCSVRYGYEVEQRIVAGDELELGMAKHGVARRINTRIVEAVLDAASDHPGVFSVPLSLAGMLDPTVFERAVLAAERSGVEPARLLFEVAVDPTGGVRPPAGWLQEADRSPVRLVHGCADLITNVASACGSFGRVEEIQTPRASVIGESGQPHSKAAVRIADWVASGLRVTVTDVDEPAVLPTLIALGVTAASGNALSVPTSAPADIPPTIKLEG